MKELKTGFAQVDFTPALGLPIYGNVRDDYSASGIHDRLYSRAFVFAGSDRRIALLSTDLCGLEQDKVAMMRDYIASKTSIYAEDVLICTTHTHGGPITYNDPYLPAVEPEIIDNFLKKAASAVILANENLSDSNLYIGYNKEERISFNRRLKCKDSKIHSNWENFPDDFVFGPSGPIDPLVTTLTVQQNSRPKAAMVNFALHPAILAGDNHLYTADFCGYLAEAMTKIFDNDFITGFFNGCCGNINHIDYTDPTQGRGYMMAQRVGYMLAVSAKEAINNQIPINGNEIAVSRQIVPIGRIKINDEQLKWAEDILAKAKNNPGHWQIDGLSEEVYAKMWVQMHEVQNEIEIMAIRIGDLGIVGFPGELFCELGMQIKKQSKSKHTIVIELANGWIKYIPTATAIQEGGFGADIGTTRYEKGTGEKLVNVALKQLEELFSSS
ncbi:MAG: neutral/alkaline non-lysosomal ceramidase N-terminal domain-containing protein [Sedimentisphaerales bacterium]|nr:neutral/alkaline non-lysosomal ceramidase N-terminal domain-containing protein [Sedimentisphaerales bacterium]